MKIAQIFAGKEYERRSTKFVEALKEEGHELVTVLKKRGSYPSFVLSAVNQLIHEKPEWIHAHRISGYVPAMIYKILNPKVKIIYDKHDIHKLDFIFDNLLFFSKWVFVCSALHYSHLIKKTKRCKKIPNYSTFVPLRNSTKKQVRKELGLKKEDTFILFQGSIIRDYGLDLLIRAMQNISDKRIKVFIIGWIKDKEYWEEIRLKLSENIIYLGSKPFNEMNKYVGSADVGLILFKKSRLTLFGDPNKMYEFLNCRVPIISTDFDYVREIFEKYGGGVIVKDENQLRQAIIRLSDKKQRNKIKTRWNLSWGSIKNDYLKLLK